ncbi:hypothetical protein BDR26DRAFT_900855 [Obelidium mucronatum]|nr:hypothetical protein BDR26DRAFT_900855 [Obelidium mucronatum]
MIPPSSLVLQQLRAHSHQQRERLRQSRILESIPVQPVPLANPTLARDALPSASLSLHTYAAGAYAFDFDFEYAHADPCGCAWRLVDAADALTSPSGNHTSPPSPRAATVCGFAGELHCPLCVTVFRRVGATRCCGALVCAACVHRWTRHAADLRRTPTCPFCRAPLASEAALDCAGARVGALQARLDALHVLCPFGRVENACAWVGARAGLNAHLKAGCRAARSHFPDDEQLDDLVALMNPPDTVKDCMHPFCIRARELADRQPFAPSTSGRNIPLQYVPRRYVVPMLLANLLEDWRVYSTRQNPDGLNDDPQPLDIDEYRDFARLAVEVRYFRQMLLNLALFATYLMVLMLFWKVLMDM